MNASESTDANQLVFEQCIAFPKSSSLSAFLRLARTPLRATASMAGINGNSSSSSNGTQLVVSTLGPAGTYSHQVCLACYFGTKLHLTDCLPTDVIGLLSVNLQMLILQATVQLFGQDAEIRLEQTIRGI